MIQLYLLSVLCNGLSGFILFSGNEEDSFDKPPVSLNSPTAHLVLGILSVVTGILKILSPIPSANGNSVFLLGDLLPAAAGILAGLILIFGIYRQDVSTNTPETSGSLDRFASSLLHYRKFVGILFMAAAFIHFIFAGLPLL
jgi:hypothetical protein